eukprot:3442686-Rhodomonas_salina.2
MGNVWHGSWMASAQQHAHAVAAEPKPVSNTANTLKFKTSLRFLVFDVAEEGGWYPFLEV